MKKVVYNGGKEAMYFCTEPTALVLGQEYEVISKEVMAYQTNYFLKGVEGKFNSEWFYEPEEKNFFLAVARAIPAKGKPYNCYKVDFVARKVQLIPCSTSLVQDITPLGDGLLQVETQNSVYFVKVGR